MESKNTSNEQSRTSGTGHSSTGSTGSTGSSGSAGRGSTGSGSTGSNVTGGSGSTAGSSTQNRPTASAPQRAHETPGGALNEATSRGAEMYDQTKQAVSNAYDRTAETLSGTYDQAMSYGREHPGQLTLIAFGAGIAIGLLLASSARPSRTERIAEPVVNALSRVAMEFLR